MASFIENVNNLADKLDVVVSANDIFDEGVIPILSEIADLDLNEAIDDLKKGNYLGNRKIDINLALNMVGVDEDLILNNPDAAEAIWTDNTKTVMYDSATALFVDGTSIPITFEFDNAPISISTHADLIQQLNRFDIVDAVAQVNTINNITVADSTLYTVTIDNIAYNYTSGVGATIADIIAGLILEINVTETNGSVPVTAAASGLDAITLTADVAGTDFTATVNAGMSIAITTANVVAGPAETPFLAKLTGTSLAAFPSTVVGEFARFYDIIGQSSNLERLTLNAVSGDYKTQTPVYFWAKTTSAFETLSMRAGDIIKIGNEIDNVILLANSIEQLILLQERIPELIDTYTNDIANGDETLYNRLTELVAIYNNLTAITSVYSNIASVNTVSGDLNGTNATTTVATDLAKGLGTNQPTDSSILNALTNATAAAQSASEASGSAQSAADQVPLAAAQVTLAAGHAQTASDKAAIAEQVLDMTASASTLVEGSPASASYNPTTGIMTFGVPVGATGEKGDPFVVNAVGLLVDRSTYDAQPKGFSFLATDTSNLYFKLSNTTADWSAGAPFGKGDTGDTGNGIASITLTGTVGSVDTYRILYTDATFFDFTVTNGSVTSVAGKTGDVILVKADVGLANVDNTSDIAKPVSTAQQTALDLKANQATTYTKTEVDNADSLKAPKANPIFTGLITEEVSVSTLTLGATSSVQTYTATADFTIVDDLTEGQSVVFQLINAGWTPTYATTVWVGGVEPTLTTEDVIVFYKIGTTLYGAYVGSVVA